MVTIVATGIVTGKAVTKCHSDILKFPASLEQWHERQLQLDHHLTYGFTVLS